MLVCSASARRQSRGSRAAAEAAGHPRAGRRPPREGLRPASSTPASPTARGTSIKRATPRQSSLWRNRPVSPRHPPVQRLTGSLPRLGSAQPLKRPEAPSAKSPGIFSESSGTFLPKKSGAPSAKSPGSLSAKRPLLAGRKQGGPSAKSPGSLSPKNHSPKARLPKAPYSPQAALAGARAPLPEAPSPARKRPGRPWAKSLEVPSLVGGARAVALSTEPPSERCSCETKRKPRPQPQQRGAARWFAHLVDPA
mmetsp:Transcript_41183/g.101643  ORF Transcript_41183/g.101643 Transcript_41183/m.101643 type:complete len:252 (+) Transcript_41183:182-937(+)